MDQSMDYQSPSEPQTVILPRNLATLAAVSICTLWFTWRLWKFTIAPNIYPMKPKELPYLIPYIGHALPFFHNSYQVLEKGRQYFDNSQEPYSITVAGKVIYIITAPEDLANMYKQVAGISWVRFVQDLYRWMGISQINMEKLWRNPTKEVRLLHPIRKHPPNDMVEEYQFHQLLPGERLDQISRLFVDILDQKLRSEYLWKNCPYVLETSPDAIKISMIDWTSDVFIRATTEIYWGKSIWKVAPNLMESFLAWEKTSWKYIFQLPRFLSEDMYAARAQLVDAFTAYFRQPKEMKDDANYFVKSAEEELRDIGIDEHNIGKIHMLQHWAVNGNVHKVTFWIFAYLAHNPELLESIRAEVAPCIINDAPNVSYLVDNSPRLEAVWLEVLRLETSSSLMRHVTEATVIGGKRLERGNNVMVPYRLLHFEEDVWGKNASQFDPERFLKQKNLSRSTNFRPFGGGRNLCPGRFLAKQVVFTFVALSLYRFDISLDHTGLGNGSLDEKTQRFPRAELSRPGLATLAPVAEDKLVLRLKPPTLQDLLAHPERAKRIADNSVRTLRDRYLTPAAEACSWRKLIKGYGSVSFEPKFYNDDGTWRGVPFESVALTRKVKWEAHEWRNGTENC